MKRTTCFILLLATLLLLAGAACGREEPEAETTEAPETLAPTEAPEVTGAPEAAEVSLEGVNAENYPRLNGSTANIPLLVELYSRVCGVPAEEAETVVTVSGGTGAVWRAMMEGYADMLLVYEAPEAVKAEMEASGLMDELEITPLGRDALVFLVNSDNPVDGLTREELVGIYTGEITNWSQVGGADEPIAAFQRNEESGSQTLFLALLMGDTAPMEPPTEWVSTGMGELIDAVAEYDSSGGAIGFSVYYYANLMYENPSLKLLEVDGVSPSAQSISGGDYPLVNDFYAVIRMSEAEDSPVRLLRDWLLSHEGRQLLLDMDYVPAF